MIQKIDHIGIAVKSIYEALPFYQQQFGIKETAFEEVQDQQVRIAFLPVEGIQLELLEPTSENSPISKFIQKRGPGIHHIAFVVSQLEESLNILAENGIELIDKCPRKGAQNKQIAFLHPKSTQGCLFELIQKPQ